VSDNGRSPTGAPPRATRPRVFGIGLGKTGTSSLHKALELLGYRCLHSGGVETAASVLRAIDESRPLLHYLDPELDAFTDVLPVRAYFHLADVQYPGSKFVLTVRDPQQWLESLRRHVERNQERKAAGKLHDQFDLGAVELDGWATEYRRHEAVVRGYFAQRPDDLLVLDIPAGVGWEPLCGFLDRPVPDAPFPWSNRFRPRVPAPDDQPQMR
jgi:Sulfotransferase domain